MVAHMILKQKLLGKEYGLSDTRLSEAINDITSTFCGRTFENMMPLVLEVLEKMTKKYDLEKETICVSFGTIKLLGPLDLFKFMNEIVDLSMLCPCEEVLRSILGLASKIIFNFQKEYRALVNEAEDMEMPIFCSLTNSNMKFLTNLKQFEDRIVKFGLLQEETVLQVL